MPKSQSNAGTGGRPALRRNQACRTCRKRKLKCDAARPHCGTCVKNWQNTVSVPAPVGYAHPPEPQCSYDPVEGLSLAPEIDPMEKIRLLEEEVSTLKSRLFEQHMSVSPPATHAHPSLGPHSLRPGSGSSGGSQTPESRAAPISLPVASLDVSRMMTSQSPEPMQERLSHSPEMKHAQNDNSLDSKSSDPFLELLFSGWNSDLPDPTVLHHYIEVFFRCDPCGSRVLHKPSFMASLHLSPRDPGFPHSAILHAICASASRWTSQDAVTLPDGMRRDQFAEYHASKTRQHIDKTMGNGRDIFAVMQACVILAWYFYQEGRWVEVWIFAGFQTRVAVPLRLNHPGTFSQHGGETPGAYLAPPKDGLDLECRRRTWWMTIVFDRIASVGGWIHAIDERDLGTELPLRMEDFEAECDVLSNPQDMATPDVFTRHPPQYTDSFLLMIKAVMLFGRVTDFNVRGHLRSKMPPSKSQNPFFLQGFEPLDKLVCERFLESLPQMFKNNFGVNDSPNGSTLDTDLYMVHIIPHAAAITLHNPYLDFNDQQSVSTSRCVHSARSILAAYYMLSGSSLDITRLHPFVTICWYLAAVVQIQLCKYFIEMGDTVRESTVWGEINILRFAMLEYGHRSPIGTRQERLLQGLMQEIVRMTAQKQPLEVGVPLYPFSHAGVFGPGSRPTPTDGADEPAPLPVSPPFDEAHHNVPSPPSISAIPPTHHRRSTVSSVMSPGSWGVPDIAVSPPGTTDSPMPMEGQRRTSANMVSPEAYH